MAKIEDGIKNVEALKLKLEKLSRLWQQSPQAKQFGQDIVAQITKRTRLGKGVPGEGGELEPLKGLADSTIQTRKRYQKNLSELTRAKKSNLTATGQMLEDIVFNIKDGGFLFFFRSRRRNRELSGSRGKTTNAEVARYVSEDRPFFNLSRTELAGYAVRLKREFLKIIRGR